jgi:hypothetical protein
MTQELLFYDAATGNIAREGSAPRQLHGLATGGGLSKGWTRGRHGRVSASPKRTTALVGPAEGGSKPCIDGAKLKESINVGQDLGSHLLYNSRGRFAG